MDLSPSERLFKIHHHPSFVFFFDFFPSLWNRFSPSGITRSLLNTTVTDMKGILVPLVVLLLTASQSDSSRSSSHSSSSSSSKVDHYRTEYSQPNVHHTRHPIKGRIEEEQEGEGGVRNCSRCFMQTEARSRRLEEVKLEILHKLGLSQAPNVTIKDLPRIPPLQNLLGDDMSDDYYHQEENEDEQMVGDMPASNTPTSHQSPLHEFEDFYVNTEKSISFAKIREFQPF